MPDNEYKEILNTSLEKIKSFAETETAIGNPISLPFGITLLPITKVSMGLATGGLGFGSKNDSKLNRSKNFTAGGGSGVSITPIAFFVVCQDGTYDIVSIKDPAETDSIEKITSLLEKSPTILKKIKNIISQKPSNTQS